MNDRLNAKRGWWRGPILGLVIAMLVASNAHPQNFDFERLNEQIRDHTVILEVQIEISFGTQTNEHVQRLLGTVVTVDGLVIFDGSLLREESPFVPSLGFSFRTTPQKITVTTLDEVEYEAEYLGVDRFTGLGFARVAAAAKEFKPIKFVAVDRFKIGDWLAAYALLPEFVEPPLAADIGMISSVVTAPEEFPLTVGFSGLEFASVLYDEKLRPVGLLGELTDPSHSGGDPGGMAESFGAGQFPLLGVITVDRLEALITDPPRPGQADRSWLGITMQALTEDIAEFLGVDTAGGIIVNEVVPGSPAQEGRLEIGDIIFAVDNERVMVDRDEKLAVFQRLVSEIRPGTAVELGVYRRADSGLDTLRLNTILAAAPLAASDADKYEFEPFELTVRDLVFSDFLSYNVDQNSLEGVVVDELKPGGLANISGLRPGDVIQRVNDLSVKSVPEVTTVLDEVESEAPAEVVFFVWRFGQTMFVNVRTDWQ